MDEKLTSAPSSYWDFITSNPIISKASSALDAIQQKRESLGLSNPGQMDFIAKEVERDVFLNAHALPGLRAEITKTLAYGKPFFQVSHQFAMGSQQPPYTLIAMYGSPKMFMQYMMSSERNVSTKFNWRWTKGWVSKASLQMAGDDAQQPPMVSIENDYTGADFTASLKLMNPSMLEGGFTGMASAEYLQSITPRLSLGLSALYQRISMQQGPESLVSYGARYKGNDWIGTARLLPVGGVQLSYWRRLAPKIETGADVSVSLAGPSPESMMFGGPQSGPKFEGTATLGAKYEFRTALLRAQIDSHGKLGCLLEKVIAPPVRVTFFGQLDHIKNDAKLGLGVQIESMSEDVQEQTVSLSGDSMGSIPF